MTLNYTLRVYYMCTLLDTYIHTYIYICINICIYVHIYILHFIIIFLLYYVKLCCQLTVSSIMYIYICIHHRNDQNRLVPLGARQVGSQDHDSSPWPGPLGFWMGCGKWVEIAKSQTLSHFAKVYVHTHTYCIHIYIHIYLSIYLWM